MGANHNSSTISSSLILSSWPVLRPTSVYSHSHAVVRRMLLMPRKTLESRIRVVLSWPPPRMMTVTVNWTSNEWRRQLLQTPLGLTANHSSLNRQKRRGSRPRHHGPCQPLMQWPNSRIFRSLPTLSNNPSNRWLR